VAQRASGDFAASEVVLSAPVRSVLQEAPLVVARPLTQAEIARSYPQRSHEERADKRLISFFTHDAAHNRHVVLRDKEQAVARRHGTILRSGQGMLLDATTLCATCWMHGVFATLLTIGNTSFHKLFSAARDHSRGRAYPSWGRRCVFSGEKIRRDISVTPGRRCHG
jgi:1,2-beta-oligoglucan phosphorylase